VVGLDERLEGALVAGAQPREKLGLLGGGDSSPLVFLDFGHA
jgi:hypothetical protein